MCMRRLCTKTPEQSGALKAILASRPRRRGLAPWRRKGDCLPGSVIMLIRLRSMGTSRTGFAALATLHYQLSHFYNQTIELDASDVGWLDGNMAAPLGGVLRLAIDKGNTIEFIRLHDRVMRVLSRSGFLSTPAVDYFHTSIPFKRFDRSESIGFAEYTEQQMQGRGIPNLSKQLRAKFLEGLDEIFSNAVIHSKSSIGVFCCGQSYPKAAKIKFTISDCGIGIRRSLLESRGLNKTADQAIEWAMSEAATSRSGDVPGGLGLKILREFIEMNGGEIQIVSETGYWHLHQKTVTMHQYFRPYPGTIVSIQINTSDRNAYYLSTEINADNIF